MPGRKSLSDIFRTQSKVANIRPSQRAIRPTAELSRDIGRQRGQYKAESLRDSTALDRSNTVLANARRDLRTRKRQENAANFIEVGNVGITAGTAHERMQAARQQELMAEQQADMLEAIRDSIAQNPETIRQILNPDMPNGAEYDELMKPGRELSPNEGGFYA